MSPNFSILGFGSSSLFLVAIAMVSVLATIFDSQVSFAQTNPVAADWALRAGNSSGDADDGFAVSSFPDGSSVVTGYFGGSAVFGAYTLTSGGASDVFVAKIDKDGDFVWAIQGGGVGGHTAYGIAALPDGSSVLTGTFGGNATFGSISLSGSNNEVFVAKLDPNGNFLWAKKAGGSGNDYGQGIAVGDDGSIFVTGFFEGNATFGSSPLSSSGDKDIFITKLTSEGTFVWAARGGSTNIDIGLGLAALADGSCVATGHIGGNSTFGTISVSSSSGGDPFIAKLDENGVFRWVVTGNTTGHGERVAPLADGSTVAIGWFNGSATFGGTSVPGVGYTDAFVTKVNADGVVQWAVNAGSANSWVWGHDISTLSDGSSVIAGEFLSNATFGSTSFASAGDTDAFLAKLDSSGNFMWATRGGGTAPDKGMGVAALSDGPIILTGYFEGTASYDGLSITSAGYHDVFVVGYLDVPSPPVDITASAGLGEATINWTDVGPAVTQYSVTSNPAGLTCSVIPPALSCVVGGMTPGQAYTFNVKSSNARGAGAVSAASNSVTSTQPVPTSTPEVEPLTAPKIKVNKRTAELTAVGKFNQEDRVLFIIDGPRSSKKAGRKRKTARGGVSTYAAVFPNLKRGRYQAQWELQDKDGPARVSERRSFRVR
jgi:hypothetical protein